jgi:Tol biopolymer transport system component
VSERETETPAEDPQGPLGGRLDSWKDIASYLKRDVSTVQRWEKREGMPVHRHLHGKLGSVYAFRSELDAWWQRRALSSQPAASPVEQGDDSPTIPASSRRGRRVALMAAGVGALAALLGIAAWTALRSDYYWRNPLANAQFRALTDFDGNEFAAAISRDGRFIAFLSDRDGQMDVWITQIGTGQFHNLTRGAVAELVNPSVRSIAFSPDGALVAFWVRRPGATRPDDISVWSAPTWGQTPQPFLEGVAEIDWSIDGKSLVYHTPGPGDPTFVRNLADGADRRIFAASAGLHAHFPIWSPDDAFIYFVQGTVSDAMDIWRIKAAGGTAERLTVHNARVSHPAFLDRSTLAYLATAPDGSGPWLFGLDLRSRAAHRLSVGLEKYTSLSASADGRKLVATVARPKGTLWRVPISESQIGTSAAERIVVPGGRAVAPRVARDFLIYVTSRDDGDSISKLADARTTELWSAAAARVIGAPAISPDGRRIAFTAEQNTHARLYTMNADGSAVREASQVREPRGAPAWSPDGRSLAIAQEVDGTPHLVRVGVDDNTITPLLSEYSIEPAWSPDGSFLVYSGADVGTTFPVKVFSFDGSTRAALPMTLTRGGRRVQFLPRKRALVFLKGEIDHKNLWLRDLDTGVERQLTDFAPDVHVNDFDVTPDGREIVFDQVQETSDVVLIEIPPD